MSARKGLGPTKDEIVIIADQSSCNYGVMVVGTIRVPTNGAV